MDMASAFPDPGEELYRVVRPWHLYDYGHRPPAVTSAAFKTRPGEAGLSVDRQAGRARSEAVAAFERRGFEGRVVMFTVSDLDAAACRLVADPSEHNPCHCLIPDLTDQGARRLARAAKIVSGELGK